MLDTFTKFVDLVVRKAEIHLLVLFRVKFGFNGMSDAMSQSQNNCEIIKLSKHAASFNSDEKLLLQLIKRVEFHVVCSPCP